MKTSASDETNKARMRDSAAPNIDAEACDAAGISSSALELVEDMPSSMATRSLEAQAVAAAPSPTVLSTDPVVRLPAALAQIILCLLPLHDRMRCREVSRAWRAALADRGCWRVLCFSGCQDLPRIRDRYSGPRDLILAAGRAAGGAAEEIDARGVPWDDSLKWVAEENGRSLRVLRVSGTGKAFAAAERLDPAAANRLDLEPAARWLESGKLPHLEELEVEVRAESVDEACRLLGDARQPDGRLKALRVRVLHIRAGCTSFAGAYETPEKQREVAESLAELLRTAPSRHPSLTELTLSNMPLLHPGLVDALADAAVACGLESLHHYGQHIDHTCLPALSRALRCGRLRSLLLVDGSYYCVPGSRTLDGPRGTHEEFCAALRGSRLEIFRLHGLRLLADQNNCRALLEALTAHPTLRSFGILLDDSGDAASSAAAAEAAAALIEANAPALESLAIASCGLGAEHLERILGALRGNTHITTLKCTQHSGAKGVNEAFARRVVLPIVQANTTLRELQWDSDRCGAAGKEVDALIRKAARAEDIGPRVMTSW